MYLIAGANASEFLTCEASRWPVPTPLRAEPASGFVVFFVKAAFSTAGATFPFTLKEFGHIVKVIIVILPPEGEPDPCLT